MPASRRNSRPGFTLIELVVVIVILGILAAFAVPRFVNISAQARADAVRNLAGSLRSASALAHGLALAQGKTAAIGETVEIEGRAVDLVHGYPAATATGIGHALARLDGFTATASDTTMTFTPTNAPAVPLHCQVTYRQAASRSAPATVTLSIAEPDGCN